ncbi:nucleotidyltransferase domain-containing protein [Rhodocyclus purpureus]|uniref:nucleotidyltransferase domain-containing protein n=1 Tax=Rhodocyclus purpureus TaxID=1067 RepID=UPI0019140963|nr:nucleotidyltransferase domain-containing protein [Rhodocyclus purpureus]MBK5915242.1 transcriptional regulator [Rhodocyclus purpureus]
MKAASAAETRISLADALFSSLQQRLLRLLFGQSGRSFYGNELLRLTGTGRGGLQRELEKWAASGLITISTVGNQKHYQANPDSPIFSELRGIALKSCGLADVLRDALAEVADRIQLAFVFGSLAKGTDTAASDIDLMIVSDSLAYADVFERVASAEATLGRKINPTLYTPVELATKFRAGNHFISSVLDQPKIFLIGSEHELPTR